MICGHPDQLERFSLREERSDWTFTQNVLWSVLWLAHIFTYLFYTFYPIKPPFYVIQLLKTNWITDKDSIPNKKSTIEALEQLNRPKMFYRKWTGGPICHRYKLSFVCLYNTLKCLLCSLIVMWDISIERKLNDQYDNIYELAVGV